MCVCVHVQSEGEVEYVAGDDFEESDVSDIEVCLFFTLRILSL